MFKRIPIIFLFAALIGLWQLGCESERPVVEGKFLDTRQTESEADFRNFALDLELMSEASSRTLSQTKSDELAAKQAMSKDLRLMAEAMVMDHKKMHDRLLSLLDHKDMAITPRATPSIEPQVKRLTAAGADFDSAYLAMVIIDHQKFIDELQEMQMTMNDPEGAQWLEQNIKLNENHITKAQNSLDAYLRKSVASE